MHICGTRGKWVNFWDVQPYCCMYTFEISHWQPKNHYYYKFIWPILMGFFSSILWWLVMSVYCDLSYWTFGQHCWCHILQADFMIFNFFPQLYRSYFCGIWWLSFFFINFRTVLASFQEYVRWGVCDFTYHVLYINMDKWREYCGTLVGQIP